MRIVILTRDSLPANVITATLMRELPGRVVGIIASSVVVPPMAKRHGFWHRARRVASMYLVVGRHALEVRLLNALASMRNAKLAPRLVDIASEAAIPLVRVHDSGGRDAVESLRALAPELLVTIHFNQKLSSEILGTARYGAINMHPSLLPKHRGPAPQFWTLTAGESSTGVTVFWTDEGFDTGDILLQREVAVPRGASVSALIGALALPAAHALIDAIRLMEAGMFPRRPQEVRAGSYESLPNLSGLVQLWGRGGRYGSGRELIEACQAAEQPD